ncbi:GNAT family N-acetyltransferase [Celeribacter marinus]|uniref:GNAT family N-acetyltransferase n=1 Tax=Celeribacter marinus TaxID=1397108 RepID=UPI00317935A7
MKLRPLTTADADACYALFYRTVRGGTGAFYTIDQQEAWAPDAPRAGDDWPAHLTQGFAICATKHDWIVGFFTMGADGHIDFAYVALEEMGKGTATALYEMCEYTARAAGLTGMTTEASHLARRFFTKHGWVTDARQTVIRGGVGIDNFRMFKLL